MSDPAETTFDVVVIGGGVVGCAILRALSAFAAAIALVEGNPDIGEGTSKANSAIVHTGFDAPPDSLEARLLAEARELWPEVIADLQIPYLQVGAVMVATNQAEQEALREKILPKARRNGVAVQRIGGDDLRELAPSITAQAREGIVIEGEGIIDPFWTTRAACENAVANGARVFRGEPVTRIEPGAASIRVQTGSGRTLRTRLLINAAGLWADEVAALAGDRSFQITGRKGEFLITEEDVGVGQIVLPVPTPISKGILVTPIVFGGTLMGPTAEDVTDKEDTATTRAGMEAVRNGAAKLVPGIATASTIRQFAGVRAVGSTGDYIIRPSAVSDRLIHVAGIRSTGLSASPAIGQHVARMAAERLGLRSSTSYQPALPELLGEPTTAGSDVVCLCRSITRAEIVAALRSPLPPQSLDGLKRRTGAMLGECQGNICAPHLLAAFQSALGRDPLSVDKHLAGSPLVVARVAQSERRNGLGASATATETGNA